MKDKMYKVYCGDLLKDCSYLEILNPNFGFKKRRNVFNDGDPFDNFMEPIVEVVEDPALCDFILIPHNFLFIKNRTEYIDNIVSISKKNSKKIVLFAIGDSSESINIPNSIVIRTSQYSRDKKQNEIIMPAYANDLSTGGQIYPREKSSIPVVGFCGWAGLNDYKSKLIFQIKNLFKYGPYKKGLYFRMKAINLLKKSNLVEVNFKIRNSYSANMKTISVDPILARREYIENMLASDLILAPKGDGNFSVRFYEALSMGRVPVLIDTDCILPQEDKIDYSKFILKVPLSQLNNLDRVIANFYNSLSNEEWLLMQQTAKNVFDQYLRIDVFFRYIFNYENHILS